VSLIWSSALSDWAQTFADDVAGMKTLNRIDYVVLNAGILDYPNVCILALRSASMLIP